MPGAEHRAIIGGRTRAQRQRARAGICLRDAGITMQTRQRYWAGVKLLLPFIKDASCLEQLGSITEEWVELQWHNGSTLGSTGDCLCGLQYCWAETKPCLKAAWRLYKIWRKLEVPCRAPPLSATIVQAMVAVLVSATETAAAFLIAVGFHAYLRTGELLKLQFRDVQLSADAGVVTVRAGKTGRRHDVNEAVAIHDPLVRELGHLTRLLPHANLKSNRVWPGSAYSFRRLFLNTIKQLHITDLGYKPYSLRRGGATHDFMTKVFDPRSVAQLGCGPTVY